MVDQTSLDVTITVKSMADQKQEYSVKLAEELANYENLDKVHDLPPIFHYWSNKYLLPRFRSLSFDSLTDFFVSHIAQRCAAAGDRVCHVISLGAGNCDFEIDLAKELRGRDVCNFRFECLEINEAMLDRGRDVASAFGLVDNFLFTKCDLNNWSQDSPCDVAIANHSLHHIVALESVFDGVLAGLRPKGFFLINDMIGRNGHMRWPEALEVIQELWATLPRKYKYNHQLKEIQDEFVNWNCASEGFEGVRAQDILPEVRNRFQFAVFLAFSNIIDVFIDRGFGPNFEPNNAWDRSFIDKVQSIDDELLESGRVKPTHMIAALTKEAVEPRVYKHLTPAFCTRWPSVTDISARTYSDGQAPTASVATSQQP